MFLREPPTQMVDTDPTSKSLLSSVLCELPPSSYFTPAPGTGEDELGIFGKPECGTPLRCFSRNEIMEGDSLLFGTDRDTVFIRWGNGGYSLFKRGAKTIFQQVSWLEGPQVA
ncbi:hypothetical protein AGDE_14695 [Angomonas deanei]|uniref:Uncharacterized protein n=1 Tax=Angomonas deanei TaxID=59799 RepID=A0A7G2CBH8_9TRYP|nr:hypothetical protein AGDE_14695 [Angomonas deanei]CAD2215392.1 hypothetical protein, conserved [Angomonas deanei]|eukprot:EPY20402.1 hypothetical protein AGDE_14695 [Angomonas deanei]